jgi:hypothetical protein
VLVCDFEATMTNPLQTVRDAFISRLNLAPDDQPLPDFLLATLVANQMKSVSDPLWCWLIGPPGSGKNESMRIYQGHPTTFYLTELTENSLMSGHKDDDNPDVDPSLLPQLDGKVLMFEDTSSLLEMGDKSINKIMGTLRNLYGDEPQSKASGSAGVRTYHARFGILFGTTPAIDSVTARHSQLGERFVAFRIGRRAARRPLSARKESLSHVRRSMPTKDVWRKELRSAAQTALDHILDAIKRPGGEDMTIPDSTTNQLDELADFVARLRTVPVAGMAVDPETGNRLVQQFVALGTAHALCESRHEWDVYDTMFIQRIANDTVPRWVVELLCQLAPSVEDEDDTLERPKLNYLALSNRITAVSQQTLALYIRQYRYLNIITADSNTGYNDTIQLTQETLAQLKTSGLLFGERND